MTISRILNPDALTCAAMGVFVMLLAGALAPLLGLPQPLLFWSGAVLLAIALFMHGLARMRRTPPAVSGW